MVAFNQYKTQLTSKIISLSIRLRIFNAYVVTVFLYNCELWSLTKTQEERIDCFHRNLLRKLLKIKWPYIISNKKLYERTKEEKWSNKIKLRRLRWLGHLMRMPDDTPAKIAMKEALRKVKKPRGKTKTSWIEMMNKQLKQLNGPQIETGLIDLQDLANNRELWNEFVEGAVAKPTNGGQA